MRSLPIVDEFKKEAANALFTREQAMQVTLKLLARELESPANKPEETEVLKKAVEYFNFQHLDATVSETDGMLDAFNVPRLTTYDIVEAIKTVIFEAD